MHLKTGCFYWIISISFRLALSCLAYGFYSAQNQLKTTEKYSDTTLNFFEKNGSNSN